LFDGEGFLPPTAEAEVGLDDLGGDDRLDAYLVDFGGSADGRFVVDGCDANQAPCAGHLVVENDFSGYSYGSLAEAADTVVSHELFHAVQASYVRDLPVWISEGTAVWAQRLHEPDSEDYLRFVNAYLDQLERSLDRPPSGPVPSFAYGTALWWDHLVRRHDATWIDGYLRALGRDASDPVSTMQVLLEAYDDTLQDAWLDFAIANLQTGDRAVSGQGHPYAASLRPADASEDGPSWEAALRVFPLSVRYDRIAPAPEVLRVTYSEPTATAHLTIVPERSDGTLGPSLGSWATPDVPDTIPVDAPAVWLVTSHGPADGSLKGTLCAGPLGDACDIEASDTDAPDVEPPRGGCGRTSPTMGAMLLAVALGRSRRRRPRRTT